MDALKNAMTQVIRESGCAPQYLFVTSGILRAQYVQHGEQEIHRRIAEVAVDVVKEFEDIAVGVTYIPNDREAHYGFCTMIQDATSVERLASLFHTVSATKAVVLHSGTYTIQGADYNVETNTFANTWGVEYGTSHQDISALESLRAKLMTARTRGIKTVIDAGSHGYAVAGVVARSVDDLKSASDAPEAVTSAHALFRICNELGMTYVLPSREHCKIETSYATSFAIDVPGTVVVDWGNKQMQIPSMKINVKIAQQSL